MVRFEGVIQVFKCVVDEVWNYLFVDIVEVQFWYWVECFVYDCGVVFMLFLEDYLEGYWV